MMPRILPRGTVNLWIASYHMVTSEKAWDESFQKKLCNILLQCVSSSSTEREIFRQIISGDKHSQTSYPCLFPYLLVCQGLSSLYPVLLVNSARLKASVTHKEAAKQHLGPR